MQLRRSIIQSDIDMKFKIIVFLLIVFTFSFCGESAELDSYGNPTVNIVQDTLVLTANESFFSPTGTLRTHMRDRTFGNENNKGEYIKELSNMPATFTEVSPIEITKQTAKLVFNVTDLGTNGSAEIFYGTEEGLTKEDKWANRKSISVIKGGNTIVIDNLASATEYFYRIRVKNNQGIAWSFDTNSFKTK